MKNKFKGAYLYLIVVAVLFGAVLYFQGRDVSRNIENVAYGELIQDVKDKKIERITVELSDGNAGNAKFIYSQENQGSQGNQQNLENKKKSVTVPIEEQEFMRFYHDLPDDVRNSVILETKYPEPSLWGPILQIIAIVGMVAIIMIFFVQQMQGGGGGGGRIMSFGKSKAKMTLDEKGSITFKDVAGLDEEKEEVAEVVDFLKNQNRYIQVGAKIPKGMLLVGPPGTGKTLLAKAVAGEAGVPFFSISGSDFVEMFVGVGASRVRDLFEQAKKNAPSIVFIDEIDAVGRKRGAGLGGGHDEREQTLNQLLVEMDGFGANEGVIIIAATNRADVLDPALLRPGRFDRQIVVGRPDIKGRSAILKVHAKGKPLQEDVDLETIARTTSGFTGADLANLMNEAALLTARHNKRAVDMEEVQKAFIKITVGTEKKSHVITEKEKRITAYHEIGHALIHEVLESLDPVHSISIIPTGFAGGYTMPIPKEDRMYMTKTKMIDEIVSLLGGRAAEELVIGDITTGASNDIERATHIARDMVTKYGMSELGPMKFGDEQEEVFLGRDFTHTRNYSEDVATQIDKHIKELIERCYVRAKEILELNTEILHRSAEILMKKEKLTGKEFRKIMKGEEIDTEHLDELNIFDLEEDETIAAKTESAAEPTEE